MLLVQFVEQQCLRFFELASFEARIEPERRIPRAPRVGPTGGDPDQIEAPWSSENSCEFGSDL